jgi:hypothetical protein
MVIRMINKIKEVINKHLNEVKENKNKQLNEVSNITKDTKEEINMKEKF